MLAIPNKRMVVSVSAAKVLALRVGTSEARCVDAFRSSPAAFDLRPGMHRHRCRLSSRRGSGGKSTGQAIVWAARLEQTGEGAALCISSWGGRRLKREPVQTPEQHQQEEKADHEQEHEHEQMKRHQNPRYLKWEAGRSSL
jgi:hypothetical protein